MHRLPVLPETPPMRCDAHCTLCCSEAVPVSERELEAVLLYANEHDVLPQSDPTLCPWYGADPKLPGRCGVYEARPIVCRVFGHAPRVECDLGYSTMMSEEAQGRFGVAFLEVGPPTRFLHEVRESGQAVVHPEVWRFVNDNRRGAGLPSLERKGIDHG